MKLEKKNYQKISKLIRKYKFSNFELITNYGLFSGDTNLFKTLKIFELLMQVKNVKGDIIELGIHKGNTSLLIKKILDIFKIKKRLFLLDHFEGLIHYSKKDTKLSLKFKNQYKAPKKIVLDFLNFFKLKNIEILEQDASKIKKGYFKDKKFSLAYFDMDLYEPTLQALESIDKNMSRGGLIVFDEGNKKLWSERFAIKEFLKNKKNYKRMLISTMRQPDVLLKKM